MSWKNESEKYFKTLGRSLACSNGVRGQYLCGNPIGNCVAASGKEKPVNLERPEQKVKFSLSGRVPVAEYTTG
jgi:hypothetical protein